ncbi:MAG: hypothetical protein CFE44_02120 [Burkholderiales bacterium PBB4]|nr:MAG: hypothetical protein CFE44_02120 [Burkholderiales bacterium PBB4]
MRIFNNSPLERFIIFAAAIFFSILGLDSDFCAGISIVLLLLIFSRNSIEDGLGPLTVLTLVYTIYILPRSLTILFGSSQYFELFSVDLENREWVVILTLESILFVMGYLASTPRSNQFAFTVTQKIEGTDVWIMWGSIAISLSTILLYVNSMGGISSILSEYSAERYIEITENEKISFVKNIAIYSLMGAFIFSSSVYLRNGIKFYIYALISVGAIFISILFIKREYLLDVLIVIALVGWLKGFLKNWVTVFVVSTVALLTMFGLYLWRSAIDFTEINSSISSIFNTAEFWVFDQFVLVTQSGFDLVGWDYGNRIALATVAPFLDFSEYVPLDWLLVESATGIKRWGIPPTIFGYIFIVYGWVGIFFIAPVFGYSIGLVRSLLLSRLNLGAVWFAVYALFLMFVWFLFRNGDPAIAVFFTNRIAIYVLFVFFISNILSSKRSPMV